MTAVKSQMKVLLPCIAAMALAGVMALASAGCGSKADNSSGTPVASTTPPTNAAPPGQSPNLAATMQQQGNGMSAAMSAAHQPSAPVGKASQ